DVGDGCLPPAQKTVGLAGVRQQLRRLPDSGGDPVMAALADAAERFPIPLAAFDELIDGCQADVDGRSYDSFDDLVDYCRCVAGSVGRLSLGVYDPPALGRARPLADALGVA